MEGVRGPLKAAAIAGFTVGTLLMLINPPSMSGAIALLYYVAGGLTLVALTTWASLGLGGGDGPSESEMDRMIERSEALAREPAPELEPDEFDQLVIDAIDDLPAEFRGLLDSTPVIVSHHGHEYHAYGHYMGGTIARDLYHDKIVIYRDTLERDFGHEPDLLRAQVERTLRHEIAHHLGWDERGVADLGL